MKRVYDRPKPRTSSVCLLFDSPAPRERTKATHHLRPSRAEGEGFEPSIRLTTDNGFRDRRIRPLCHPSERAVAQRSEEGSRGNPGFPRAPTEREGFEPSTHHAARTRFPVALLRPLGHLSERW